MSDSKHTRWKVSQDGMSVVDESTNALIAEVFDGKPNVDTDKVISRAHAAYIVQCCNAHDKLVEALKDMSSGWRYIRDTHGDLYGVGWDRAQNKADSALRAAGEEL